MEIKDEDLSEAVEAQRERLLRQAAIAQLSMESAVSESIMDMFTNFVDPLERFYDPDGGELWSPVSVSPGKKRGNQQSGYLPLLTIEDLERARNVCRILAVDNEFAQNALLNRAAFTVGIGISYQAVPRKPLMGFEEPEALTKRKQTLAIEAQRFIDEFIAHENWGELEQELVTREDRDGEWFLRRFFTQEGLRVRVVEPEEIYTPQEKATAPNVYMGIECDSVDSQMVEGYYVNGMLVDAEEIEHRKGNVDRNVMRGIPTIWSVRKNFSRAAKLQRNMSTVAAIQAALAAIRKFTNSSEKQVQDFVDKKANISFDPNVNSVAASSGVGIRLDKVRIDKWAPGTILNMPMGQELDYPGKAIDASKFIAILDAELRAIAARFVMPEYMLTSNASNANYASTLEAGTPAFRQFQKMQGIYINRGIKVMVWVIECAIGNGFLPEDTLSLISISGEAPDVMIRDSKKEAETNEIKARNGVLSVQTWSMRDGLDYQQEQQNIKQYNEEFGGMADLPLPMPPDDDADAS